MQASTSRSFRFADRDVLRDFFDEYQWIHLTLGLVGNTLFILGSVLFLFEGQLRVFGVWAFVVGSFLMLVGSLGEALVKYARNEL
jgi:membrane-bound ClpP family serine protease